MDTVLLTVADGVATISLNRPDRHNAIDDELAVRLQEVWGQVQADDAARVVVLRGEGKSFCSGRDTAQLGRRVDAESDLSFVRRSQRFRQTQLDSPKPVVAAVRGHAQGGGLEMALSADIRIAATDVKMAFPEIRHGLMTDTGGSPLTTMLAGPSRAKLMLMTGKPIDADKALAWGLVDDVVPPEALDDRVAELAAELADKPAEALAMIKQTVDGMWRGQQRAAFDAELIAQVALFGCDDYKARRARRLGA